LCGVGPPFAAPVPFSARRSSRQTALEFYRRHQYAKATETFEKAVATEPKDGKEYRESVLLFGQNYCLTGARVNAIEVSYMLGNAHTQTRQPQKAVDPFAVMFGFKPNSAAAHLITAQFMVRQEFEEDARKERTTAVQLDPNLPQTHDLLGEMAIFRANIDTAIEELTREIAMNPDFAIAYYKLGELANAEGMLRRALATDPNNYSAHYMLGQVLMQEEKTEEGKKMLDKSRELQQPGLH